MPTPDTTSLEAARVRLGCDWPNSALAEKKSRETLDQLVTIFTEQRPLPTDCGLVVFGSLARCEFTEGSDLDWTLLVDGRCDSDHGQSVQDVREAIARARLRGPGPTETFGGLTFAPMLVHDIGGEDDTNRNMTRRLLLLLESRALPLADSEAVRTRVVRALLRKYVLEDGRYSDPARGFARVPKFLLNDVVRLWRTMAVDYAHKFATRGSGKWALRNIKLRMSRRLISVHGLLMCLTWPPSDTAIDASTRDDTPARLIEHLERFTSITPLCSLAWAFETYEPSHTRAALDAYDEFLGILADPDKRQQLEDLTPENPSNDAVFRSARECSRRFKQALMQLLVVGTSRLAESFRKDGVF